MIKKLQYQFIAVAMGSLLLVMLIVFGTINFVNLYNITSEVYTKLTFLSGTDGKMEISRNSIRKKVKFISDEFPYETRYFSVVVTDDGKIANISLEHIAAINRDEATRLAGQVLTRSTQYGRISTATHVYAYQLTKKDNRNSFIIFLDCTADVKTAHSFISLCTIIGLISYIAVFILVCISSKHVVQPVIKNFERQRQFITNAGHELKTPLAIISANTEVLEMMNGESEWTQSTIHQTKRMTELVNSFIRMARMEENRDNLVLEDVDLTDLTNESATSFVTLAESHGIKLTRNITDNIHLQADRNFLQELISIFLDNAVKYCDENGSIDITLSRGVRNIRLIVSNDYADGANIDYKRFFERFYRADASHNSGKGGYGIGLSMAQEIVSMMKGKLLVDWKKGRIIFTVVLPSN